MKVLFLHVDFIKFKPLKKALKSVEELPEKDKKEKEVREALVVMTAVEKQDSDTKKIVAKLVENVKDIAKQVNAEKIVFYPYAHLSNNLATPEHAVEVMNEAEKELKKNFDVIKAPFGYYKELELKVKGHPLSELSREIKIDSDGKIVEDEIPRDELLKKMTKVKMSAPKGIKGLKSNVELGRDLDLYIVSEIVGSGLPLFTPKGATIKREIERFITDEELKRGYLYTSTPLMAKKDLYMVSGHWQHYKENMFVLNVGDETFALRPMTCPFQFILYKRKPRSYKDLPLKYAEISTLFRNEKSGELRGLTRVRQFTLSDAHLICRPDQLEEEFEGVLNLIKFVMEKLGIKDIWYRFSKWDPKDKEKYIDNPKMWESSQKMMKKILDKSKIKYIEAEGEAAFYGPKLDLQYKDVYGKEDTLITVQIDMALPEKFDMSYKDKDNSEKRPVVIHRSSSGATERVIAYLLEKNQGALPVWLSPVQVKIINFTDRNTDSCEKFAKELENNNIRIERDFRQISVPAKIKDAELMKIPYIIVIGDKEKEQDTLAVRKRGEGKPKFGIKKETFIKEILDEIKNKI